MGTLTNLLGRAPRVAILEVFAENSGEEYSVPELVSESSVSKRGAYMHVRKLLEEGVLRKSRKVGKCWFYRLNENDRRGEILPLLESVLTLGRIERGIKRDMGVAPDQPLPMPELPLRAHLLAGYEPLSPEPVLWRAVGSVSFPRLIGAAFEETYIKTLTGATSVTELACPEFLGKETQRGLFPSMPRTEQRPHAYRLKAADSIAAA